MITGRRPFATDEELQFLATKYATSEPAVVVLVRRELARREANRKKLSALHGRPTRPYKAARP